VRSALGLREVSGKSRITADNKLATATYWDILPGTSGLSMEKLCVQV
jgi:hypothetical protein